MKFLMFKPLLSAKIDILPPSQGGLYGYFLRFSPFNPLPIGVMRTLQPHKHIKIFHKLLLVG